MSGAAPNPHAEASPSTWRLAVRTLVTRDWALAALAVIVGMIAATLLGLWQYGRYQDKALRRDRIESFYSAPPVPLQNVLPTPQTSLPAAQEWRTVTITGTYCTDPHCILYVRNRPRNGAVGFWQLVPLRTASGTVLVVRGWVNAQEQASAPLNPPSPPTGTVTVQAHLRPDEPRLPDRTDPPGQVQSITPSEVRGELGSIDGLYTGAYAEMYAESPAARTAPLRLERPDTGLGPHLSYAVQWWALAALLPVAWVLRARGAVRDARRLGDEDPHEAPDNPGEAADGSHAADASARTDPSAPPIVVRRARPEHRGPRPTSQRVVRRRGRDEEEEDALLDDRSR